MGWLHFDAGKIGSETDTQAFPRWNERLYIIELLCKTTKENQPGYPLDRDGNDADVLETVRVGVNWTSSKAHVIIWAEYMLGALYRASFTA